MKKLYCILICFVICLCFAACGKAKDNSSADAVDIDYYVSVGKMPESKYDLGADVQKTVSDLEAAAQEAEKLHEETGEEYYYSTYTVGDYTAVTDGSITYYYFTEETDKGICYIVNFGTSYGIEQGAYSVEVKQTLDSLKIEYTERKLDSNETFFVPGAFNITGIEYTSGKNTVLFVFEEDMLCACALYR